MTLADILPEIQALSTADRKELALYLAKEIAKEQGFSETETPVLQKLWSQHNAVEAAAMLQQMLDEQPR